MIRQNLFILAHQIGNTGFYSTYRRLMKTQWMSYSELRSKQDSQLRNLVNYAFLNVPYYHKLFRDLGLNPDDIRVVSDLEKLPILTKDIIKQNWDNFRPLNSNNFNYYERSTGGSTGTPFKYRLNKFDRFLGGALCYRGWSYAGYELGDRTLFIGGSSLGVNARSNIKKFIHETARNIRMLSSFDMGEDDMYNYMRIINNFKPKYIYGYASSLYFFAKWIDENGVDIYTPNGIYSTAEKLFPNMKQKIGRVFGADVYDTYGLNDGGVSAYECDQHSGLHIDMERSVMELVDTDGHQLEEGEGQILATSLYNYSMPFIRYDTGDLGHIILESCCCGRGFRLLQNITGRQQEILFTPEGKNIHGEFFTHIFWEIQGVKEFQVVQKTLNKIIIKIVPENDFDEIQLVRIREYIKNRSRGWDVEFNLVDKISRTRAGKYKFVINEMKQ